jgi:hypothetical protein
MMDRRMRQQLDRYITGNYGEDQFARQEEIDDEECICKDYGYPKTECKACQKKIIEKLRDKDDRQKTV